MVRTMPFPLLFLALTAALGAGCLRPHADSRSGFLEGGHYRELDVDAPALELEPWGPLDHRPELGQPFYLVRGEPLPGLELDVWHLDDAHRRVAVYRCDRRGTILEAWRFYRIGRQGARTVLLVEEVRPWIAVRPDRPADPPPPYRVFLGLADEEWVEDGQVGRPATGPEPTEVLAERNRYRVRATPDRRRLLVEALGPDGAVVERRHLAFDRHPIDDVVDFVATDAAAAPYDHRTDPDSPAIWWEDGPGG